MTDLTWASATTLLAALHDGSVTSQDLVRHLNARVERHNPALNAVVATQFDHALQRAAQADAARERGESWGPLHGVPMTIKDTYEVVGMPTTAGSPKFRDHRPTTHAPAVQKLIDAGAIVFGKTNVPLFAGDLQSYNKVYGTTNNPWDLTRTPAGSSGGAAAALAAGLTPIELGSDIGGSLRTPAHYCGVFAHKPSHGLISLRGHIPGPPGTLAHPDLAVAGPMARCAEDLALMLDLIAGPDTPEATAWRLDLPKPQHQTLKDFRIAVWLDHPRCPVEPNVLAVYDAAIEALEAAGATVDRTATQDWDLAEFVDPYNTMLAAVMSAGMPAKVINRLRLLAPLMPLISRLKPPAPGTGEYLKGVLMPHREWLVAREIRERLRHRVAGFFDDYDILWTPVTPWTALEHNQEGQILQREVMIDGRSRPYLDHFPWISMATLLGLPATAAPLGLDEAGLPVNGQFIGGPFQDHSCIEFSRLVSEVVGGFTPPPGYDD